jgi:hypothetical protein
MIIYGIVFAKINTNIHFITIQKIDKRETLCIKYEGIFRSTPEKFNPVD